MTRNESVVRAAALLAVVWGGVDLAWRAVVTWEGSGPTLFLLLYVCEFLGWAMLVSFCYLAWRTPKGERPAVGLPPTVDEAVRTHGSLDVPPSVTAARPERPDPRHEHPERTDAESVEQLLVAARAAAG